MTLHLHGVGHFHPENEITNRFLEELDIGTNEQWIMDRVGIRSRRTVLPLDYIRETRNREPRAALEAAEYTNAELGRRAAEVAIRRAGLAVQDIGMVIAGNSASDTVTPAEACTIARALELEVPSLDVSSACTSFFAHIHLLCMMRPEALPPYVLLVAPEALTKTVHYEDRSTAVLWGDGAAAAVVSTQVPGPARVLGSVLESSPSGAEKVLVTRLGHFTQDGHAVQMFAIKRTRQTLLRLRSEYEDPDREFHFIGHQANLRMLQNVWKQFEIPPERQHQNVEWFGNTGAASAAGVLSQRWEKWDPRDDVALVGVGGGLTWAGYWIRFGGLGGLGAPGDAS